MQPSRLNSQRGAAIIVALFIVSLVTAAAVAMMIRLQIDMRRTELTAHATQAALYAQGSLAWASLTLSENATKQKPNQLVDRLPIQSPLAKMDGYEIYSIIDDEQAKFNLNNLVSEEYMHNFTRLIHACAPTLSLETINQIVLATRHWIIDTKNADLDAYYAKQTPTYRPSHHPMVSATELRLVRGVDAGLYQRLIPFITALPSVTQININNAAIPVLLSLSPQLTPEAAEAIRVHFKAAPANTIQDFTNFEVVKNNNIPSAQITTTSSYFLVKTNVRVEQHQSVIYTLLARVSKGKEPSIHILWQSKGTP